jgi:hypothetical protein
MDSGLFGATDEAVPPDCGVFEAIHEAGSNGLPVIRSDRRGGLRRLRAIRSDRRDGLCGLPAIRSDRRGTRSRIAPQSGATAGHPLRIAGNPERPPGTLAGLPAIRDHPPASSHAWTRAPESAERSPVHMRKLDGRHEFAPAGPQNGYESRLYGARPTARQLAQTPRRQVCPTRSCARQSGPCCLLARCSPLPP